MSTSDRQPSSVPVRVVPPGVSRAEYRRFLKALRKKQKQARCRGVLAMTPLLLGPERIPGCWSIPSLALGTRVRISGTLGESRTIISARMGRHGWWYEFKSDCGNTVEGYFDYGADRVLALPVEAGA